MNQCSTSDFAFWSIIAVLLVILLVVGGCELFRKKGKREVDETGDQEEVFVDGKENYANCRRSAVGPSATHGLKSLEPMDAGVQKMTDMRELGNIVASEKPKEGAPVSKEYEKVWENLDSGLGREQFKTVDMEKAKEAAVVVGPNTYILENVQLDKSLVSSRPLARSVGMNTLGFRNEGRVPQPKISPESTCFMSTDAHYAARKNSGF